MKLLRIEHKKHKNGMWYNPDGKLDPFIMSLTEGKSKNIPMEFDNKYRKNGFKWYSGVPNLELLKHWFSTKDIIEMIDGGYGLYEIKAKQVNLEDNQILYTRESIVYQREISLDMVLNKGSLT